MSGYTESRDGEMAGVVHRGEFWSPCSCGGRVHAYDDGEVIHHSLPLDTEIEHRVTHPKGMDLLFDYKLVE